MIGKKENHQTALFCCRIWKLMIDKGLKTLGIEGFHLGLSVRPFDVSID